MLAIFLIPFPYACIRAFLSKFQFISQTDQNNKISISNIWRLYSRLPMSPDLSVDIKENLERCKEYAVSYTVCSESAPASVFLLIVESSTAHLLLLAI